MHDINRILPFMHVTLFTVFPRSDTTLVVPGNILFSTSVHIYHCFLPPTATSLQERAGCKMQMIQDGQFANAPEKPLRMTGLPESCKVGVCVCSALLLYPSVEDATATKTLSVEGLYTYWMVGCVNSLNLHQSSHPEEPASYPGYTNNWRWPGHGFSYVLCQCIKLTITLLTGNSHSRWWRPCQGVTRAAALSSGCIVCLKSPCTSLERRSSFHAV